MLDKFRHKPAESRPFWLVDRLFAGWHPFCCVKGSTKGFNQEVPQSQITECNAMNTSVEFEHVGPAAADAPAVAASVMLPIDFQRGFGSFAHLKAIPARQRECLPTCHQT
jgi:hypothetical protein